MNNFTPGPWRVYASHPSVYADGQGSIAILSTRNGFQKGTSPRGKSQAIADANLMAAAPEMYEALRVLAEKFPILLAGLGNSPDVVESNIYVKNAVAALAKAEGKAVNE